jgi:hypothetical protein
MVETVTSYGALNDKILQIKKLAWYYYVKSVSDSAEPLHQLRKLRMVRPIRDSGLKELFLIVL